MGFTLAAEPANAGMENGAQNDLLPRVQDSLPYGRVVAPIEVQCILHFRCGIREKVLQRRKRDRGVCRWHQYLEGHVRLTKGPQRTQDIAAKSPALRQYATRGQTGIPNSLNNRSQASIAFC